MITLKDVWVEYSDSKPLRGVNRSFSEDSAAVMGPSGSGKTTLLRLIAGLQKPTSGVVEVNGERVAQPSWTSAGEARVSLIHQDYRLVPFLSVDENLRLAAEMRGLTATGMEVKQLLNRVGLENVTSDRLPATLSGGEQQRLAIARSLLCRVDVLLADEPTGALDEENTIKVADLLATIGSEGRAQVLIATHDSTVAASMASTYKLGDGLLR